MKKLNLGCGKKILDGYINVDIQQADGIDKSFDFDKFPYPFKDNEFDYIFADNVLEHLKDPIMVLNELHRITKRHGIIHIIVPYYNCAGAYNDITHKHWFNTNSIKEFTLGNQYDHKKKIKFDLVKLEPVPTFLGKLFPRSIRERVSFIIGEIIKEIDFELRVIK